MHSFWMKLAYSCFARVPDWLVRVAKAEIEKVRRPMRAGKLRGLAGCGLVAAGVVALASGCSGASSSSAAPGAALPPATPSMTPTAVPVLGKLSFGTFPASTDGLKALDMCEQWAQLRAQYVSRVKSSTACALRIRSQ